MLSRNGHNNNDGSFNWKDAIADAMIMSGITFFATLGGIGAVGLLGNPTLGVTAAFIASGGQFFAIMAMKRGLIKKEGD